MSKFSKFWMLPLVSKSWFTRISDAAKRSCSPFGVIALLLVAQCPLGMTAESQPPPLRQDSEHASNPADRLLQQGDRHYQNGQFDAAIKSWQQAREAYRTLQNLPGEANALEKLGAVMVQIERYQSAITTLEAFLPIARSLNNTTAEARALGNLGIAYQAVGNYAKAINLHKQAGRLMHQINDRSGLGKALVNLGNAFESVGDYSNATIAYQQGLKISQHTGNRQDESVAQGNLGAIHAHSGQYDAAIAAFNNSLAIARAIHYPVGQASALLNLGSAYHSLNQVNNAISYYQQSLKIAQAAGDRKQQSEVLGSLGLAFEDLKDYSKAIHYHQKSLEIARSRQDPEAEAMALNNLGHTLFKAGKLPQAEAALRSAIKVLDALRPGLTDTYKVSIFDTQTHTYNLLQQVLVADNKPEAALEASEQGRSRAFAELLAGKLAADVTDKAAADSLSKSSPLSIGQIRQIARQQNATLVEYSVIPADEFKFRGKQRGKASALLIWVVQPTGKVAVRRVDLTAAEPLTAQTSPGKATPGDRGAQTGVAVADVVSQTRHSIRGRAAADVNNPARDNTLAFSFEPDRVSNQLKQLYRWLIAPISDLLPTDPTAHVVFIPHESLFLIPFPALRHPDGKYLIEQHTVLTAPSIQVLGLTGELRVRSEERGVRSQQNSPHPALIIGNPVMPSLPAPPGQPSQPLSPLPGAEEEAIAIAQLLNTTAMTGAAATKATVLQKLPQAALVHLATHGLLEYGDQSSGSLLQGLGVPGAIALAPSGSDNGFLTASEILNLRLRAQLVVLSACDTGQGRITGDGVIGLSRAFISAGVPSIIVSLWAVPDAPTAQLMTHFYKALQQSPDKARALRQAMLATMQEYPKPLDWAAFTLIGAAE